MRRTLPTKWQLQLLQAASEKPAAVQRILDTEGFADCQQGPAPTQQPASSQLPYPEGAFKVTIEGDPMTGRFCIRVAPAKEAGQAVPPEPSQPDEPNLGIAAKVFELLTALDPDKRLRKAPPIRVFNLYYRQRLQPAEIARICKCHRSLVFDRLAAIQQKLPWTPQQLHELSPQVEAMQHTLSDSRACEIHRKSAAYGDGDRKSD